MTDMIDGWRVHKFGGSSVADATCMRRVADILDGESGSRLAVVLSASRGVTDSLLNLVTAAERQQDFAPAIESLKLRHREMASSLLAAPDASDYAGEFERDCNDIFSILQAVRLTRSAATTIRD